MGRGVRRLVLRPLRAAALLSGDRRQHRRHPRPGLADRRRDLARQRPESHWNGQYYQSMLPVPRTTGPRTTRTSTSSWRRSTAPSQSPTPSSSRPQRSCAANGPTRPRSTSTRSTAADQQRGLGPLLGRYPGDVYDGDTDARSATTPGRYPLPTSPSCTTGWQTKSPPPERSRSTISLPASSPSSGSTCRPRRPRCGAALQSAGDAMLQAIVFHSDHLELSEQFDATPAYQKSVSNLSWCYASFLSAIRARAQAAGRLPIWLWGARTVPVAVTWAYRQSARIR